MKIAGRILLFGLCLNLSVFMISGILGVSPTITQVNLDQIDDALNATDIVETWNWGGTGSLVGDIGSGLRFLWDVNLPIIESVLILLDNIGTPAPVFFALKTLWRFIWNWFVIEFISGRRVMY